MSKNRFRVHGVSNSLWNEDLAPVAREDRRWGLWDLCSVWLAAAVGVPAWLLAGGLVASGMTAGQAAGTLLVGSVLALLPMGLSGAGGITFGVPSTVLLRASFGVIGARVPAVLRALVSSGWFGIQCWIGGLAMYAVLRLMMPGIHAEAKACCFAVFWVASVALAVWMPLRGRAVREGSTLLLLAGAVGLLLMIGMGARPGEALEGALNVVPCDETQMQLFRKILGGSLTAVFGFWSVVVLTASDVTRHMRTQGVGGRRPWAGSFFQLVGVAAVLAVVIMMPGVLVWNPVDLILRLHQPVLATLGLVAVAVGTMGANLSMNVVEPAAVFSGLRPKAISPRMGAVIVGLVGMVAMPWRLTADPARYVGGWLLVVSGILGPVAGVMIMDYFVVRRRSLDVEGLYVRGGQYEYSAGFNVRALRAMAAGMIVAFAGLLFPRLHLLFEYAWFVGFGVAALVYLALMSGPAERASISPTPLLIPMQGFEGEGA
ncbi:cytosine permease [Granulicella arctica]|uniref:cytosine permease n=1 Tax=Granulicella arctica TaxID=940613 RepID=UPI0021E037CD|nr:cytosine permease [Granulicella arctica]